MKGRDANPDVRVIDYLRRRGDGPPPSTLADEVVAAAAQTPQDRRSPMPSFGTPLLAAAVVVMVVAVTLGGLAVIDRNVGDDATPSPSPSAPPSTPTVSASPSPSPTVAPFRDALLEPGDEVELAAVDAGGEWGSIRIERGGDLGGYADADIGPDMFVIELFVEYEAERMPDPAEFGSRDWSLRPTDPDAVHFFLVEPRQFEREAGGIRPAEPLGLFPGAIDIFTTPMRGWIAFGVTRREANLDLELVYSPAGVDAPAAVVPVRSSGDPPEPVEYVGPTPGPEYVEQPGFPITVIDSAEADALFDRPDSCTNPVDGYSVTFPDDWYTNTEINDTPACSWFTPEFFEAPDPGQSPDEIWISLSVVDGAIGYIGTTEVYSDEEVTIDGLTTHRREFNSNPNGTPEHRSYHYVIRLGGEAEGPTFVAGTNTDMADDYELARAVLDRIMASLDFDG